MGELLRRRAMMAAISRRIPSGYTELEYLIAPQGAYFHDTFAGDEPMDGFAAKYRITARSNNWAPYLFSAGPTMFIPRMTRNVYIRVGGVNTGENFSSSYASFSSLNTDYEVEANADGNGRLLSNGNLIMTLAVGSDNLSSACSILMEQSEPNVKGAGRLYWLRLYASGVCTHEYVPCIRNTDQVVGVYDTATRKFLTNVGTGTVTPGPEIGG